MEKAQREYIKYVLLLPKKLSVDIHKAKEGGFWAKVKELPGCNTQGEDFVDLVEMVNDAIFTYFEVPKKTRGALGHYIPKLPEGSKKDLEARIRHAKIEETATKIIKTKKTLEFSNVGIS
jgi:predicted RNase H-like HicB family nuclease